MVLLKQYIEDIEMFADEIKAAKVIKVFYFVNITSEKIVGNIPTQESDGTRSGTQQVQGSRMVANMQLTALAPLTIMNGQIIPGDRAYLVSNQFLAEGNCFTKEDDEAFNAAVLESRNGVLDKIKDKVANNIFPGQITPLVGTIE